MKKNFYCGVQDQNLAFDPTRVDTGEHSGRLFTFGEADDTGHWPWRFLTPDEETEYATWQDRQRAADDGFGAAIGTNVDVKPDDNDLGTRWGESSAVPQSVTEAYEASAGTKENIEFDGGSGVPALSQIGEIKTIAQKMLYEATTDPINKRFALLVFRMKDVDPETTAGEVESIQRISTSDDEMIVDYAKQMVLEKLLSRVRGDGIGTPANSLEI